MRKACGFPLFQPAFIGAEVFIAQFQQLLRRHAALRTLQAAAVYDDSRTLGQIRGLHLTELVEGQAARAANVLNIYSECSLTASRRWINVRRGCSPSGPSSLR